MQAEVGVALDDLAPRAAVRQSGKLVAVHQHEVRLRRQCRDGAAHGKQRGLQDVDFVDNIGIHRLNAVGQGALRNLFKEAPPRFFRELFGVVKPVKAGVRRQNDGRRNNGARQRPPPPASSTPHTRAPKSMRQMPS